MLASFYRGMPEAAAHPLAKPSRVPAARIQPNSTAKADTFQRLQFAATRTILPSDVRVFQVDPVEYPRPQLVREKWLSLNGPWDLHFDDGHLGLSEGWQQQWPRNARTIQVPYPYQSEKSGLEPDAQGVHQILWYRREFTLPEQWQRHPQWAQQDLLLNFGAVDYKSTVWINGKLAWENHQGGHVPFAVNIKPYLKAQGPNSITLRVEDPLDARMPRGKQDSSSKSRGIDYPPTSGIWQPVWLEPVPKARIEELKITPHLKGAHGRLDIHIPLRTAVQVASADVFALDGERVVAHQTAAKKLGGLQFRLTIPQAKRWSPEQPNLYNLQIRLKDRDGNIVDEVGSYAGFRSVALKDGRFRLNGQPVFLKMVLDQGYWPQSLLAAPDGEALKKDVELIKACGFNGARKHQKIEDPRYLYWADKLGLMVWGEMPNARVSTPETDEHLIREWEAAVRRDYNHPSIVTWVPGNESMGQHRLPQGDARQYNLLERLLATTRRLDTTRPVITNSGWENTENTDIIDIHDYALNGRELVNRYRPLLKGGLELPHYAGGSDRELLATEGSADAPFRRKAAYHGQPIVLSEVGGYQDAESAPMCYGKYHTPQQLVDQFKDLMAGIRELKPLITGFCYTQLTHVFQEKNGLFKFDRTPVADPAAFKQILETLDRAPTGRVLPIFKTFSQHKSALSP